MYSCDCEMYFCGCHREVSPGNVGLFKKGNKLHPSVFEPLPKALVPTCQVLKSSLLLHQTKAHWTEAAPQSPGGSLGSTEEQLPKSHVWLSAHNKPP